MDINELNDKIDRIFNYELSIRKRNSYSYTFVIHGGRPRFSGFNPILEPEPQNVHFESESVEALKKLYVSIENDLILREHFTSSMINKIKVGKTIIYNQMHYDLSFMTLIYLGNTNNSLEALYQRVENGLPILNHLQFLRGFVHNHYIYLNEDQLTNIRLFLSERNFGMHYPQKTADEIIEMVDKILFDNLKLQLGGINYEVELDKQKIQKFISKYNFDNAVSKALDKIDEEFSKTTEDEFDLRNNISLLKEIFDNFMSSLLTKLIEITDRNPTKKDEKEHDTQMKHRFIGESMDFSEGEIKTMSALNKMLNEEKHSLMSKKEKFRISRIFTIEFLLLCSIKFEKIKS